MKVYKRKRKSRFFLIFIVIGFISFFVLFLIRTLNKRAYEIAVFDIEKRIDRNVLKYYNFDNVLNYSVDDLITIEYNQTKDNIINVKYNVHNTNTFIDNNINQIEDVLLLNKNNNWFNDKNYLVIHLPIGMAFDNLYLESYGPKIPFRIYYIESYYINLNTKITNYGINNSLVELYIVLTIKYRVIANKTKTIEKHYDYLLAATLVNGKVPSIYENGLEKESNIVEIK